MYGIFFEDINHAADGGLYAELIQNRDFEYNRTPEDMHWVDDSTIINPNGWKGTYRHPTDLQFWSLIQEGGASARMELDTAQPLHPSNSQSMKFEVLKATPGRAAVANRGFWGIPLCKGATYELSFYARKDAKSKGEITATLENATGQIFASQRIPDITGQWKRYRATFTSTGNDQHARLVLSAGSLGTIWFDVVSLFPAETWKNHGLRKDLSQLLADMRPSFLRFPGGCVVEGATLENRFQWKRTVGDIAARPGHWNLWGYHSTDGLGFHEYLQLCEDLGAAPLYVINVGMSCQGRAGMVVDKEHLKDYLQEALDALEYAMGPVTSHWGAMRATNGHPAPFIVKHVEIGNENGGPDYQRAYRFIQSGIKKAYPGIITIADEPVMLTPQDRKSYPGVSLEMIDEHYYQSPAFFYEQAKRYDTYDRSDSVGIYIGEFAVTAGSPGKGNLRAALGESAFMVGMERNADIVRMASYAPTFVNVNDRAWNPDMIVYDGSRSYGTPSYHAIKMFSLNRPDRVLPTSVEYAVDTAGRRWEHLRGGIALSTWNTVAEYKDVRVQKNSQTLFFDDFSSGATRWAQKQDVWEVTNGAFRNKNTVVEGIADAGEQGWTDYTLTLKARKISGEEGFIVYVLRNEESQCLWNIGGWGNSTDVLMQDRTDLGKRQEIRIETGKWYEIKIEVSGHRIRCYLDGVLKHDAQLHEKYFPTIFATSGIRASDGTLIIKVVNPFSEEISCQVSIKGAGAIEPTGEVVVLTSASAADENSLDEPERVAPRSVTLRDLGGAFNYRCPQNSVSVVKVKMRR
jgi:alpha-L-arabinofuranosidase